MDKKNNFGIVKLLSTTNIDFEFYINEVGILTIMKSNSNNDMYYFDMGKCFLRTSKAKKILFRDGIEDKCIMEITTLNSIYEFEVDIKHLN